MNRNGSGDKILDWTVIIAALMLFFKTADVLSYFSPTNLNEMIGMDVSLLYGVVSALLVEGAALALHFNSRARLSSTASFVKWVLLAVSGLCQIFDGYIATGNAAQMSDTLKVGLQFGVPMVPLLVIILLFAIGRLPDDGLTKRPFAGIRNIVGPAVSRLWNGEKSVGSDGNPTPGER